jgi:hypothetical protein
MMKMVVYFDKNCYKRILSGSIGNAKEMLVSIKEREQSLNYEPWVSYQALSEILMRLTIDAGSNSQMTTKGMLRLTFEHVDGEERLLRSPESEYYYFFFNDVPAEDKLKERTLYTALQKLNTVGFDDFYIRENLYSLTQSRQFVQKEKEYWSGAFVRFLKNVDHSSDGSIIYENDPERRKSFLERFSKAEESGSLYREFALGLILYVFKTYHKQVELSDYLIEQVINRFRPLFVLQAEVIKKMCQGRYMQNPTDRDNDILDFLIVANLDPESVLFVSDDRVAVQSLMQAGLQKCTCSFDQYLVRLGIQ